MMPLIGMIGVLLSVIVGYKMLQGNLSIMFQPAEFVIIGGIALFALIISSGKNFPVIFKNAAGIFKSPKTNRENYLDLLLLLHHLFAKAQREGLISLESHLDTPENSDIFKKFPS
ncbi:MAG TPA: motility-associated protein, partial [Candidatus Kapabacteria bacterium]|nr:motility-associated protein [Candidatus Kapabacteria bacterium]